MLKDDRLGNVGYRRAKIMQAIALETCEKKHVSQYVQVSLKHVIVTTKDDESDTS